MPLYTVYVEIENSGSYDIEADSEDEAINAAEEECRNDAHVRESYIQDMTPIDENNEEEDGE